MCLNYFCSFLPLWGIFNWEYYCYLQKLPRFHCFSRLLIKTIYQKEGEDFNANPPRRALLSKETVTSRLAKFYYLSPAFLGWWLSVSFHCFDNHHLIITIIAELGYRHNSRTTHPYIHILVIFTLNMTTINIYSRDGKYLAAWEWFAGHLLCQYKRSETPPSLQGQRAGGLPWEGVASFSTKRGQRHPGVLSSEQQKQSKQCRTKQEPKINPPWISGEVDTMGSVETDPITRRAGSNKESSLGLIVLQTPKQAHRY